MAKTILLADDSVTIQKVVELTFMDEDYAVVAVSDGMAALERVAEVNPDLVIADVHMPGADGYEVCRRTKESHPHIPVLLLVGTFEQFDDEKAVAAGADGNLKKPFDSQELLNQVAALVAGPAAPAGEPPVVVPATAEIPLADFTTPPAATSEAVDLFATAGPPAAEPLPPVADLEPPPLLDGSEADLDDTRPAAARAPAADDVFELAEESPAADREPVLEPEPAVMPMAAPPVAAPPVEEAEPAAAPAEAVETAGAEGEAAAAQVAANGALSDADVERIARKVAEVVGERMLREVAWEVIPDLAEVIIKERIRELESQVE